VAATGATELLSRFCDRPSLLATLLRVPPARPVLFSPSPAPPLSPPFVFRATLSCTPLPPAAESLDFIPAPQRESIVKRQRSLYLSEVVSDRRVLSRLPPNVTCPRSSKRWKNMRPARRGGRGGILSTAGRSFFAMDRTWMARGWREMHMHAKRFFGSFDRACRRNSR